MYQQSHGENGHSKIIPLRKKKGLFNQQAGFMKGRGCEDQIARVIQAIRDGFNHTPMYEKIHPGPPGLQQSVWYSMVRQTVADNARGIGTQWYAEMAMEFPRKQTGMGQIQWGEEQEPHHEHNGNQR